MWRQNLVTRIEKAFKGSRRAQASYWGRHSKEPEYEVKTGLHGIEITMDDPKLGCAVYEQLKREHPDRITTFNVQRVRCTHCGWQSPHMRVSIHLPLKGQESSDFIVSEFSKKLELAMSRRMVHHAR